MRIIPVALVIIAALAVLPWLLPGAFYVAIATHVLVAAVLALSLNILIGYCGMSSLGHAVYLGVPAYAYAWLMANTGLGVTASAILAVLCGTVLAAGFGVLALRAAGLGFLMITLALGQVVWGLSYRWVWLTGGDNGLRAARPVLPGIDLMQPRSFYYLVALVFLLALAALWQLSRSPFAACLRGSRDQPRRMRMLGHPVWLMQWAAFVLAGFWGSIAGLLYIWDYGFISPQTMSLQQSAEVLLMVVLGGAGTLAGPVAGAAVITVVKTVISSYVDRWSALLGLIFIVAVMFMPRGLVPGLAPLFSRRTPRRAPARA
ncbi:MAG: branched-chain amino acid ABC transporter permease [Acetobacteraceae bacterium]|nr:branched-chain amino acid ABC transporter permease [Acetobacteraceae bacterium]